MKIRMVGGVGSIGTALLVLAVLTTPVCAQQAAVRFAPPDTALRVAHGWTTLRVAKWGTLAVSTAAFAYGFVQNRSADRDYTAIEQICKDTTSACERTSETGPYKDAALEARYQSVVARDRHARDALLAGQVGIAASVVLFILDLPKSATPEDIPYNPRSFQVGIVHGEMHFAGRIALP